MSSLLEVAYDVILPIFIIAGLAVLLDRIFTIDPKPLSKLVIYLFTPCLVLDSIANSTLQADEMGQLALMVIIFSAAMVLVGWGIVRLFRVDPKLRSAFMLTIVLLNIGNYGIPLNKFAFGDDAEQVALLFYTLWALVAYTLGVYLASSHSFDVRKALTNVVKVPLVYAAALGLILNFGNLELPLPLTRSVDVLGGAAVPGMLAVLGLQLSRASIKGRIGPILLASGTRLIIGPLVAVAVAAVLGLSGLTRQVAIVDASMPTAVIAGVLATEFGSDAEFTTATILVSTLGSIITLSILLTLLGAGGV